MKLSEFVGLDAKMKQLIRSAQAGRIVHALLLAGPHGSGKRSFANILAQTLLCQSAGERPCGICPACKRCEANTHPDVHGITPEKNSIGVEQIRDLMETLSLASYEGGKKIVIMEHAERMTESAENALLQTLEEPGSDIMFMLLTDAPTTLLPTIVSRCLNLRMPNLQLSECAGVLERRGMDAQRAQLFAALSQGSVGRALEIGADESYLPLRERVLDALEMLDRPESIALASAQIGDVKGRENDVLEILEQWARDLMRVQNGLQSLDGENRARLCASKLCGSELLRRVLLARQQIRSNLSPVYALEFLNFGLISGRDEHIQEEQAWQP